MDEVTTSAATHFFSTSQDPLNAFMFFVIATLLSAVGILYKRNQKQNDDMVQIVKDVGVFVKDVTTAITILNERVANGFRTKD